WRRRARWILWNCIAGDRTRAAIHTARDSRFGRRRDVGLLNEARIVFTGLIEEIGVIESISQNVAGVELRIASGFTGVEPGESIAVSGPCLTVRECGDGWFSVAAMIMTIGRTTIGNWKTGRRVNLERSMRADQ